MNETTERFFREIAVRIGDDQIAEVHLFPAVRQGGMESGLAVVAAEPEKVDDPAALDAEPDAEAVEEVEVEPENVEMAEGDAEEPDAEEPAAEEPELPPTAPHRHVVYTARYRHTLKGPDRGKWEFDIKAEGDAPLITIDEVVRGVVRRSGDAFHAERIAGDDFRATVSGRAARPSAPASPPPPDTPQPDTAPV